MLKIPDSLKKESTLLFFVKTTDRSYAVEISKGLGEQWLHSDQEEFPDCDEYVNWDAAEYVGASLSGALFKEADGGMFMYSSKECSNWQNLAEEVILREVLDWYAEEKTGNVEIMVLGGAA